MDPSELDDIEAAPRGETLERTQEERPPIDDVAEATAWWGIFADGLAAGADREPGVPSPRVGRNEPCPCGSGKKYKKCHGA